jgi:hypothetical protein
MFVLINKRHRIKKKLKIKEEEEEVKRIHRRLQHLPS